MLPTHQGAGVCIAPVKPGTTALSAGNSKLTTDGDVLKDGLIVRVDFGVATVVSVFVAIEGAGVVADGQADGRPGKRLYRVVFVIHVIAVDFDRTLFLDVKTNIPHDIRRVGRHSVTHFGVYDDF